MITSWDIYWITRLDAIVGVLILAAVLLPVAVFVLAFYGDVRHDKCSYYKTGIVRCCVVFIAVVLLSTFVPSTKQFAAIYLIPKIANNEQVQKLPDNAMKFLNGKFEAWIDDMTKKEKK